MNNQSLQTIKAYLKNIEWDKKKFTNNELQGKLVKFILQYLDGNGNLQFVLEFSEAMVEKQGSNINFELKEATTILYALSEKLKKGEIKENDNETILDFVNKAQLAITGKNKIL